MRVGELGFPSIAAYLESMPSATYEDIARSLHTEIAPIQVIKAQFEEATRTGALRNAAKDSLCRSIIERFPHGWNSGDSYKWTIVKALSGWSSEIIATGGHPELKDILHEIIKCIRDAPPPNGWLPSGTNDPIIAGVFDKCWPSN
jgi:hypothetical protein